MGRRRRVSGSARIGAHFLQDKDVASVLFQSHRVCFDVTQDAVEVVLVDPQELTAILSSDDRRRPVQMIKTKFDA